MIEKRGKRSKKSQAQVVVTVLIILVVIAGVVIVSGVVINWIQTKAKFDIGELDIYIESENTFYNSDAETLYVSIRRNVGKVKSGNFTAVKIIVTTEGENRICIRENIPEELERRVYNFVGFPFKPDYVEIAPVIKSGDKEKILKIMDKFEEILIFNKEPQILAEELGGSCGDIDQLPPEAPAPPTS